MKKGILGVIIGAHALWLRGDESGRRADLCDANLRDADLRDANLRDANLLRADLCGANLLRADLCGANLRDADLCGANLRDADLRYLVGNGSPDMICLQDHWSICMTKGVMAIGCQQHDVGAWWSFSDEEINNMDYRALGWWRTHKPILQALHDAKWGGK